MRLPLRDMNGTGRVILRATPSSTALPARRCTVIMYGTMTALRCMREPFMRRIKKFIASVRPRARKN